MNDSLDLDAISVTSSPFGVTKSGEEVTYFELKNRNGVTVGVINYGLAITKILVPDKNGMLGDVVLGHDTIKGYEDENDYFGCIVGRFGNRIGEGKFQLNGQVHEIGKNNNGHSLHGGFEGFDKKVWKAEILEHADESGVIFSYRSEDGEEGYPGNMDAKVIYTLNELNEIKLYYEAVTDKKTVVNLTNHAYFNLRDAGVTDILDHELEIRASRFTPVNDEMITTGEIFSLENSPLDFRQATKIGTRLMEDETQLKNG
ncbi:MAG: aldose epimerase family protein, partial [Bacteroidota bacterium]